MKRLWIAMLWVLIALHCNGQYTEWLNSDRPGAAMSPYTVGAQTLQIQAGYTFTQWEQSYTNADFFPITEHRIAVKRIHSELAKFRLGLGEQVEINALVNFEDHHLDYRKPEAFPDISLTESYVGRAALGVRGFFLKAKGYRPAIGMELRAEFPRVSAENYDLQLGATLSVQETFTERFQLTANLIYSQQANPNSVDQYVGWALNASFQPVTRLGLFLEVTPSYLIKEGLTAKSGFVNGGGSWYVNRNFQVDLSGGWCYTKDLRNGLWMIKDGSYFNIQAGLTGRINWRH